MTPPNKRPKGKGSVYKRTSDGRYVGAVKLSDGKRHTVSDRDEQAAEAKLDALIAEHWLPADANELRKDRAETWGKAMDAVAPLVRDGVEMPGNPFADAPEPETHP